MATERLKIEPADGTWVVRAGGAVIGESARAIRLNEGDYPQVIYFPRADLGMEFLDRTDKVTTCPHKGEANYFTVSTKSGEIANVAWSYETPLNGATEIAEHIAFDADQVAVEEV